MRVREREKKEREVEVFDYDKSFQSKLVRVLYDDNEFTLSSGIYLDPAHFANKTHRYFAGKIISYAKKHGHGISRSALRNELRRDCDIGKFPRNERETAAAFIEKLNRPIKDKSYVKEELFRFIKHQAQRIAIVNSVHHLKVGDYEAVDEEFQKAQEIQESASGGLGTFYVRDVKKRTTKRKKYKKNGISTGTRFDDYLKPGGVPKRKLACIVAPSGKGKSHNLVHIGAAAILESGKKVLHVTLEMSEEDILDRYDARFSNIPSQALEDKPTAVKRSVKNLGRQFGEFLVVKEFADATLTVPALRAYIRQLERTAFYPDVVIIDYADCMIASYYSREKDSYEEQGSIYGELRKMAFELNVSVWTAAQTSRGALNKEFFDWNDIAESSKKVMKSDVVICFLQTLDEKKRKEARWWIAKNRLGPDKMDIKVRVDWSRSIVRSA